MEKIALQNREKSLIIIRQGDINLEILSEVIISLWNNLMNIDLIFLSEENTVFLDTFNSEIIYNIKTLEEIQIKEYRNIFLQYMKLEEVLKFLKLDLNNQVVKLIFNGVYENKPIYTDILEFQGICKNPYLEEKLFDIKRELLKMNIDIDFIDNFKENSRKDSSFKYIDKNVIGITDIYKKGYKNLAIKENTVITDLAKDYIKEEDIKVRRI